MLEVLMNLQITGHNVELYLLYPQLVEIKQIITLRNFLYKLVTSHCSMLEIIKEENF